jgi:hypothetical protein
MDESSLFQCQRMDKKSICMSIGNGMFLFLALLFAKSDTKFGMIVSCMAKLKFILLREGFTLEKWKEIKKPSSLSKCVCFLEKKMKQKKYEEYLKRTLPESEEVECKKCGLKFFDEWNLLSLASLDMCCFVQIEILIKKQLRRNMMSSDEPETIQPKGESLVKHCPICGVEFDETVLTNRWLKCDSCETIFQVKVKSWRIK